MAIVMGENNYGKSEVRLVKVTRGPDRHDVREVHVDVALSGDLEDVHLKGDNTDVLATDTMRNTVYALAKDHPLEDIEAFGLALGRHFLTSPLTRCARIHLVEPPWQRIEVDGKPHEHSFQRAGGGVRVATVTVTDDGETVEAGIDDLFVLKTTQSGWVGFLRDRYTTLPETNDRIFATVVTATWTYERPDVEFGRCWRTARDLILRTFTDHYSPSVQHTLYRMGERVLSELPEVRRIRISMPNKHHLLYDLGRFGMENPNEIFHASLEPYGLIEGTVERTPEPADAELAGAGARATGTGSGPAA
jgi:urate oxidase